MTRERKRPAGWQAGQGAMSAAGSGDSVGQGSAADGARKTLANLQHGIAEMERMTQDWPVEQRARVLGFLREQQRIERARLRAHNVVSAPRPAARHRRPRSRPPRVVVGVAQVVVAGDDAGGDPGVDDDDSASCRRRSA